MIKKIIIAVIIILFTTSLSVIFLFIKLNKNNMEQKSLLNLSSLAFENNQIIPEKYSCNGENINPALSIENTPAGTKSLVLVVDDPDAISGDFVHWILWNISPDTTDIEEDSIPDGSVLGLNSYKNNKYDGPCPPVGTHRYLFKLYALDTVLNLDKNSGKVDLENAMKNHIIGQTSLTGLYSK